MSTRLVPSGPLALVGRVGCFLAVVVVLSVAGVLLGAALFGPAHPDASTFPFGLGGDGPPDAVLVAPATAEPPPSTSGSSSTVGNASAPSPENESAPASSPETASSSARGRPLPPAD